MNKTFYYNSSPETFYGQFGADRIIHEKYFPKGYVGNCIEVGAVDGVDWSNTLFFEQRGWNCLCIEPQPGPGYFETLAKLRKLALNCAISSKESEDAIFTVVYAKHDKMSDFKPWNGMSGLEVDERLIDVHKNMGFQLKKEEIKVKTRRLDWCIENHFNHETIDFISIDVEGTELDVLKSFDVNKYNTKLLLIENNFEESEVEIYLDSFGWRKDMRVEVNDFYVRK